NHQLPATQAGRVLSVVATLWQNRDIKFSGDDALWILTERVRVRPVSHKSGVAGLPDIAGFFFTVGRHAHWSNGADPAFCSLEGFDRFGIIDSNLFVRVNDCSPAVAVDPFESVAGYAFTCFALE